MPDETDDPFVMPRALVAVCGCVARSVAMQEARFLYVHERDGWMFVDDPPRTTTFEKAYHAGEDHTGEPYIWTCCPWCGHDIPTPENPYGSGWPGEG